MDGERNSTLAVEAPHAAETAPALPARSVQIASSGICTDRDAADFLSALIGDVMSGAVPTRVASTSVNAMGKLLKVVEMRHKYGNPEDQSRVLELTREADPRASKRQQLLRELAALDASSATVQPKGG